MSKGFFCLHNFTLVGEEEAKLFLLKAGTSKVAQRKNSGFGFLSKLVEKIFALDNFGAMCETQNCLLMRTQQNIPMRRLDHKTVWSPLFF